MVNVILCADYETFGADIKVSNCTDGCSYSTSVNVYIEYCSCEVQN